MAAGQLSDFGYEDEVENVGLLALDRCATRNAKNRVEGDAVWCLCNKDGNLVRWHSGDEKTIQELLTATGDETQEAKQARANHDSACHKPKDKSSPRFAKCRWKGGPDGKCCPKEGACSPELGLNRK